MSILSPVDVLSLELARGSDPRIDSLQLLTPAEERQLLLDWNATQKDYPDEACIHHLFEAQATRTPQATAVSFGRHKLTYRELDARANQLAHHLRVLGAGPEVLVGVCVERSERMVIALLAVLKAGAAYVPLDPSHPPERLGFMSRDSRIRLLVTEGQLFHLLPEFSGAVVRLEADWKHLEAVKNLPVESTACSRNLAYVIYTSGSTGQPHGVMIEHRSVVNFLVSMQKQPGLCASDRVLSVTTVCFDIAALEIFLPLTVGAELVITSREVATNGGRLAKELSRREISVMQATPATWRMMLDCNWPGEPRLKALCGGEALSRELANELIHRTHSVWNLYGPTETTIWSAATRVEDEPGPVFIGQPIANTRVYILDHQHGLTPIGVPGEIYIAGDGVARGYWNRPELTADRFVELPFERGRAYKTGDMARYTADGRIEYLGRRDFQIKLRGYRIELGEIESALRRIDGINEAVVTTREHNGEKQLIAYLECERNDIAVPAKLRQRLKENLPEYMLPSAYVVLHRLPLTPSGKIDRKALPELQPSAFAATELPGQCDYLESQLTEIFEETLGITPVRATDSFFDLGGHSLLAAHLISRIEKVVGHNLPIAALFQSPTVGLLADTIRSRGWETSWSPVIELQHGTTSPFFCIHGLIANLMTYKKLARLLGPEQQFYGVQQYGLDGKREPHACIEEMARAYLTEIRRIQPRGPYQIGGVCLGGVVAFEMAQQLHAEGQEVSLLLLIDSDFPGMPEHLHIRPYRLAMADGYAGELLRLPMPEKLRYVIQKARSAVLRIVRNSLPRELREKKQASSARAISRVENANRLALFNYSPHPYPGKITLFCCSEKPTRSYEDRRLAWSQVAGGGLEVHLVPGSHNSMVEQQHMQVLAEKFRACLKRASSVRGEVISA